MNVVLLLWSLLSWLSIQDSYAFSPSSATRTTLSFHRHLSVTNRKIVPFTQSDHGNLQPQQQQRHQDMTVTTKNIHTFRTLSRCQESRGMLDQKEDTVTTVVGKASVDLEEYLYLVPPIMSCIAFFTYQEIAIGFHTTVDYLSGHNWASVDGGAYLTDLIEPALTGPVGGFISLLFGTLTSMTIGSLYSRQATMASLLDELLGDLRLLRLHVKTLPTKEYQQQAQRLIFNYGSLLLDNIQATNTSDDVLRKRREAGRRLLEQLMQLLHEISADWTVKDQLNGQGLGECYSTVNRLMKTRSSLVTNFENRFPTWHYGNLCILALTILFTFLVLTDKTALLFLGGFQLRICWSMLIGTLSMLVVVVVDLNSPLSGAYKILQPIELEEFAIEQMIEHRQSDLGTSWLTD